ncbi:hypothetical protein [Pelagicoccus sp. SDUM812003]|uniref:hypothetical protein n=1 Tax=Pelagicoccus sp. SDUM812003 TaxID=3041267 RepID=UPI00280CBFF4|nr:hypothetical protein [Pelagicoccus sp. SDUM812003]MDQ8205758.1 hypothetical protein [Pelagicoccus sp. SDUM812003]
MEKELEAEIAKLLKGLLTPGFNRSLGALEDAGAIDLRKLKKEYSGTGSKYYDIVTEQMELTVEYAKPSIHEMVKKFLASKETK